MIEPTLKELQEMYPAGTKLTHNVTGKDFTVVSVEYDSWSGIVCINCVDAENKKVFFDYRGITKAKPSPPN